MSVTDVDMFYNYDEIQSNYTPNNLRNFYPKKECDKKITINRPNKPYEMYDELGKLIGYFWYYGDTVSLDFDIFGEYTVEGNAIVVNEANQYPDSDTIGYLGQYYYNIKDDKIWKCIMIQGNTYTWEEVEEPNIPTIVKSVYIDPVDYLAGKTFYFTVYNFRGGIVYQKTVDASPSVQFFIDEELSQKMVRGTYGITLVLYDKTQGTYETLFDQEDASFLVK